jgi:hypothetical protein
MIRSQPARDERSPPSRPRSSCVGIRQQLGGLLERFVLVYGDEGGRRVAVARDEQVVAAAGDVAEDAAQLAYWNALGHVVEGAQRCTPRAARR